MQKGNEPKSINVYLLPILSKIWEHHGNIVVGGTEICYFIDIDHGGFLDCQKITGVPFAEVDFKIHYEAWPNEKLCFKIWRRLMTHDFEANAPLKYDNQIYRNFEQWEEHSDEDNTTFVSFQRGTILRSINIIYGIRESNYISSITKIPSYFSYNTESVIIQDNDDESNKWITEHREKLLEELIGGYEVYSFDDYLRLYVDLCLFRGYESGQNAPSKSQTWVSIFYLNWFEGVMGEYNFSK